MTCQGPRGLQMSKQAVRTFYFKGIGRHVALANEDDAMNIKRHLFRVGAPMFVAETVCVLSVRLGRKGKVPVRNRLVESLILAYGICDLKMGYWLEITAPPTPIFRLRLS